MFIVNRLDCILQARLLTSVEEKGFQGLTTLEEIDLMMTSVTQVQPDIFWVL
jgi:hypothetical protein